MNNIIDTIDPVYLGSELQKARTRAGVTQEKAAQHIGVSRPTLSNIENGITRIQSNKLILLSRLYNQPINDFLRKRPNITPFEPLFRGPTNKDPEIARNIAELEDLSRNYLELEEILSSSLNKNYPPEYNSDNLNIEDAAEELSLIERSRLGIGDQPIYILRDHLEQNIGLRIFYMPLAKNYSAIYIYDNIAGGCIAINSNHPEERRRWSLSHEYAHFLAHRNNPDVLNEDLKRVPDKEKFADAFAAFFLMPKNALLKRYNDIKRSQGSIKLLNLCIMSREFGVSVEAFIRHSERVKLLPSGFWNELKQGDFKPSMMMETLNLPKVPLNDSFLPTRYKALCIDALIQQKISEGQFANFLRIDKIEARYIAEQLTSEFNLTGDY